MRLICASKRVETAKPAASSSGETIFEPEDKRAYGYSRDKRSDCVQGVIALIVTPEGFPLAYEVLAGNTSDKTTLADFLQKIETQYGKAQRIWVMDTLRKDKLRAVRRREGRYLLRSNITSGRSPEELWQFYIQLTEVEAAFKNLKDDLALRPIHHQLEHRIQAHIFISFLACCLRVTLCRRLRELAPGLTPRCHGAPRRAIMRLHMV